MRAAAKGVGEGGAMRQRGKRESGQKPEWTGGDIALPPEGIDVFHRLSPINLRLRLQFLVGAEEGSLRRSGRPLTDDELRRVLARYPGDLGQQG